MELLSLPSPSVTSLPSCFTGRVFIEKQSFVSGQFLKLFNTKRYPDARKLKFLDFRTQALGSVQGTTKFNSETEKEIKKEVRSKDEGLAYVAGATGRVGSRTVRELLKLGFRVRAGVRSAQKAETLVQSIQQMKLDDGAASVEKLEIVECDLEKQDRIGPAIGNASVVICCIGASEKEVFDITGPFRIDYQATKNLIDAATIAKVNHFVLLTSLGTNKIGFPAALLNLFWGVLIWKRKAEEALIASGLPYTIVRPGGMERPTDAYKETHNILLAQEDTLFGGQVSNLQVAELMAFMAKNRSLSYCKVVEVIAETTAPLTPMGELLAKIPSQRVDISALKESQAAGELDPPPSKSIVSEASSITIEKEPAQTKAQTTRLLSPYIFYEDLKPPTSPTPTPSTTPGAIKARDVDTVQTESKPSPSSIQINLSEPVKTVVERESIQTEVKKTRPLSPYIIYEDLKPPTSPTPTPPASPKERVNVIEAVSEPNAADALTSISGPTTRPLSPYVIYEDLKPPTSPTPTPSRPKETPVSASPPMEAVPLFTEGNNVADRTPSQVVETDSSQILTQKTSRLSPFYMYEDLKPPTSPIPSPRKY